MIIDISSIVPAVSFILYIIFTIFGVSQIRKENSHPPFILYMFFMALWSFGSFMMHAGVKTTLFWNRFMMIGMLGGPITIFHSILDLLEKDNRRYRGFLYIGYFIYALLLYFNFKGYLVTSAWLENGKFYYELSKGTFVAYILSYLFLILGILFLIRELYNTKDEFTRKKIILPIIGAVVMLMGVLGNLYTPVGSYPIDLFTSTINAIIIFYAIYKYRLVHYSAFVLRSILYLVLVIISAFIFYGIIWFSSKVIRTFPFKYTFFLSLLLGFVAALIFQPLRTGTLSVIERLYFGKRLNYYRELRNFSESLTTIVDLMILGESTIKKLMNAFEPTWALMMVFDYSVRNYRMVAHEGFSINESDANNFIMPRNHPVIRMLLKRSKPIYEYQEDIKIEIELKNDGGIKLAPSMILPLIFKDKLNGFIALGKCRNKEYYDQFDAEVLEILAGQCSVALENAISFERLRKQQKRLQQINKELVISRNKLEAFFDGITSPISIQDINYNIVTVNYAAKRYFKKPLEEIVGKKCYSVFFGLDKPCENCMAQDSLHAQLPFSVERKDRRTGMIFSIHFYPISVPVGSEKIFLEFFQDITQQKRLQEELIQSEKLASIGTLASGIAHEINNPLTGIIGTAELMLEHIAEDSQLREFTMDIINYAQSAAEIIKDLTSYSRKEEGRLALVDLEEIINTSLKLAQRGMNFDGIKVEKFIDPLPRIQGNPNELRQVFLNLIMNAIQAMKGNGVLTIECKRSGGNVQISVSDTGHGIERENIEKIFNPFFTTKEPGLGTGLGLSIAHQIIYNMGGRITVESHLGRGTTFNILIPFTDKEKKRIRFVIAKNLEEIEDVFFIQRKILVGEKGYLEETIKRDIDKDAVHILAYKGLQPVGTISCITYEMTKNPPIEEYFSLEGFKKGRKWVEIDRLAVLREERRGIIPLGLMTIAYLFSKNLNVDRIFLDVFSDEKKHINMYRKLGFQIIGEYKWLLPVTVMMMDYKSNYEKKKNRMEQFVKPFLSRLMKRLDFSEDEKVKILNVIENIISGNA